ncbi:MAG: hypothetical protein HYX93_00260 [Chloroflexi bacterium]|nr:hypothetical protein [Chloroflexota bacterium]
MTVVQQLYDLLVVDSDMERHREAIDFIDSTLKDNSHLLETRKAVEEIRSTVRRQEAERRDLDRVAESAREKASQLESKLYGGSVRNPRELEDMQAEFNILRGQQRRQEDDLLRVMEASEEAEGNLGRLEKTLEEIEEARQRDEGRLMAERRELQANLDILEGKRQQLSSLVSPEHLGLYQRLRTTRQGQAVVKVERGMCQGCRITLPTRVVQQARTSPAPVQCPSCSRILYVS